MMTTARLFCLLVAALTLAACGHERNPESDQATRALLHSGDELPLDEDRDTAARAVWELAVDLEGLRAVSTGERVDAFFRTPDGRLFAFEADAVPSDRDGALRGRLYENDQARGRITLSLSGDRMVGQFTLDRDRHRIRTEGGEGRLIAIDSDRLPPPATPIKPPDPDENEEQSEEERNRQSR